MKYLAMPWSPALPYMVKPFVNLVSIEGSIVLSSHPLSFETQIAKGHRSGVRTRLPSRSYIDILGNVQAYMR